MRPSINVTVGNGNLGGQVEGTDGISVLVMAVPAAPTAGYGVTFLVRNKAEAAAALADAANADALAAVNGFYAEAPEGTKLYIRCVAQATTLAQMCDNTLTHGPGALNMAQGKARLFAAVKFPAGGYTPTTTGGFDQDVHNAVIKAQEMAAAYQVLYKPFRAIIQGYGFTNPTAAQDYSEGNKRHVSVVVGGIDGSTAKATLLALGRAAAVPVSRNIGRVKSGSLNIPETSAVTIGATAAESVTNADLDTLHTKRYITFEVNQDEPGFIWNDDNMLTAVTDDYNSLANCRVIDKALVITYTTYYRELKDEVQVNAGGRLPRTVEAQLKAKIEEDIRAGMVGEISAVSTRINPDIVLDAALYAAAGINSPNLNLLTAGGKVYIFLSIRPVGYLRNINVVIGLTYN